MSQYMVSERLGTKTCENPKRTSRFQVVRNENVSAVSARSKRNHRDWPKSVARTPSTCRGRWSNGESPYQTGRRSSPDGPGRCCTFRCPPRIKWFAAEATVRTTGNWRVLQSTPANRVWIIDAQIALRTSGDLASGSAASTGSVSTVSRSTATKQSPLGPTKDRLPSNQTASADPPHQRPKWFHLTHAIRHGCPRRYCSSPPTSMCPTDCRLRWACPQPRGHHPEQSDSPADEGFHGQG